MRNVVLYSLMSLDGVAEEPGDWFFDDGPEVFDNLGRAIETQDDVLLGRGTYEYWVGYWPTSDLEPFASFINGTRKHVVTSSAIDGDWGPLETVPGSVSDHLRALRDAPGRDIGVHGSITLAQSLLRDDLVDELRLVVAPTIAGRGRRLFGDDAPLGLLALEEVHRSAAGTVFLHYRRARRSSCGPVGR